jgi:hypothetical protein
MSWKQAQLCPVLHHQKRRVPYGTQLFSALSVLQVRVRPTEAAHEQPVGQILEAFYGGQLGDLEAVRLCLQALDVASRQVSELYHMCNTWLHPFSSIGSHCFVCLFSSPKTSCGSVSVTESFLH